MGACREQASPSQLRPGDVNASVRAANAPVDLGTAALALQRTIGNRAVACLVDRSARKRSTAGLLERSPDQATLKAGQRELARAVQARAAGSSRARTLARTCDPAIEDCGDPNDPRNYVSFEDFRAGAVGPWTDEGLRAVWDEAHPAPVTADPPPRVSHEPWEAGPRGERIPSPGYRGELRPVDEYTKPYARIYAEQGNYEAAELAEHYMCPTCHVLTQVDPADFSLRGYVTSYEHGYKTGAVLMGSAALGLAAPEVAAVLGAWDTGVSTTEAVTGETSGLHVTDPLFGVEAGRSLSTGERVFAGGTAALGWFSMGVGAIRTPGGAGTTAVRVSETTGGLTNLGSEAQTTNRLLLEGFEAGQGFSGVYDEASGRLLAVPSTRAAELPPNWVSARGGHAVVSRRLDQVIGQAAGRRAGFTAFLEADGSLGVEWLSRSVNGAANPFVPEALRPSILEALSEATGRVARSDDRARRLRPHAAGGARPGARAGNLDIAGAQPGGRRRIRRDSVSERRLLFARRDARRDRALDERDQQRLPRPRHRDGRSPRIGADRRSRPRPTVRARLPRGPAVRPGSLHSTEPGSS